MEHLKKIIFKNVFIDLSLHRGVIFNKKIYIYTEVEWEEHEFIDLKNLSF